MYLRQKNERPTFSKEATEQSVPVVYVMDIPKGSSIKNLQSKGRQYNGHQETMINKTLHTQTEEQRRD
jgi:hypothetical protein